MNEKTICPFCGEKISVLHGGVEPYFSCSLCGAPHKNLKIAIEIKKELANARSLIRVDLAMNPLELQLARANLEVLEKDAVIYDDEKIAELPDKQCKEMLKNLLSKIRCIAALRKGR